MRRALAIAAVALLAAPASALGAEVRVTALNGQTTAVDLGALRGSEDVRGQQYAVGGSSRTATGFSLEMILEEAKADPFDWQYLEVARPGGEPVVLSDEDVQDSGVFPDGPPVVTDEGAQAGFLRPSRGAGDDNSADQFSAAPLAVVLQKGQAIEVDAEASAVKVDEGDEVSFSATARGPSGATLAYSWSFGDGDNASGEAVTHSFEEPGSYVVAVGVTSATDDVGGSDALRIDVGKLKKGGPDREGGGRNDADDAPDSGSSNGGYGSGTGGYGAGSGGSGAGTGSGLSDGASAAGQIQAQEAPKEKEADPPATPGERVVGELLSASPATSESAPEGESAGARTGTPTEESGFGVPGVVVAFLGVGGLLGVGALLEGELLRFERIREAVGR